LDLQFYNLVHPYITLYIFHGVFWQEYSTNFYKQAKTSYNIDHR